MKETLNILAMLLDVLIQEQAKKELKEKYGESLKIDIPFNSMDKENLKYEITKVEKEYISILNEKRYEITEKIAEKLIELVKDK